MEFIAIIGIVATGGFTLCGVYIGSKIAFSDAIKLADANTKRLYGSKLRDAFAPELARLQNPEGFSLADAPHILKTAFHKHQIAVNEFAFFLAGETLHSFNKLWREYCDCEEGKIPDFNHCMGFPSDNEIGITTKRIKAIREFTKL